MPGKCVCWPVHPADRKWPRSSRHTAILRVLQPHAGPGGSSQLKESQLSQTWDDSLELSIGIMRAPIRQTHSHNEVLGTEDSGATPTVGAGLAQRLDDEQEVTLALSGTASDGIQVHELPTNMPNSHAIRLPTTLIQGYSARWRAASLSELLGLLRGPYYKIAGSICLCGIPWSHTSGIHLESQDACSSF